MGLALGGLWGRNASFSCRAFFFSLRVRGFRLLRHLYGHLDLGDVGDRCRASRLAARVYYGNGGRGLSVAPQQRKTDDSGPIASLGLSDSPSSFRIAVRGTTPYGRGWVTPEWEIKPLGRPFDGSDTQTGSDWSDTGVTGVAIDQLIENLDPAVYHWRARLRYETAAFQQFSRWFTVPRNGWNEADLRTVAGDAQCIDSDGDGYGTWDCLSGPDCDDSNPSCTTDCTDADADGYCTTHDCNDALSDCTIDCTDADGDDLAACAGDCDDANPNCRIDCTDADADADGYCPPHDNCPSVARST